MRLLGAQETCHAQLSQCAGLGGDDLMVVNCTGLIIRSNDISRKAGSVSPEGISPRSLDSLTRHRGWGPPVSPMRRQTTGGNLTFQTTAHGGTHFSIHLPADVLEKGAS